MLAISVLTFVRIFSHRLLAATFTPVLIPLSLLSLFLAKQMLPCLSAAFLSNAFLCFLRFVLFVKFVTFTVRILFFLFSTFAFHHFNLSVFSFLCVCMFFFFSFLLFCSYSSVFDKADLLLVCMCVCVWDYECLCLYIYILVPYKNKNKERSGGFLIRAAAFPTANITPFFPKFSLSHSLLHALSLSLRLIHSRKQNKKTIIPQVLLGDCGDGGGVVGDWGTGGCSTNQPSKSVG